MKRLFLPLLSLVMVLSLVVSCNSDDDGVNYDLKLVAIDSVQFPVDTLKRGEKYNIDISYTRPNACYEFYTFQATRDESDSHVRTVSVINVVYNQEECDSLSGEKVITKELPFQVERGDYYTFKFFKGYDDDNEPIFIEKEIPVKKGAE